MVGRNLTDTVGYSMSGYVPALAGMPRHNSDGIGGMHVYVPWWLYGDKNKDFPRGYHIEIGGGFGMPELGSFAGQCARHEGYGKQAQGRDPRRVRRVRELCRPRRDDPQPQSYCEIDPERVDAWGIPVLRFHFGWSEHEIEQVKPHGGDLRLHHRNHGRHGDQPAPGSRARHLDRRHHHSRSRHGADGQRSEDLGAERYCQAHDVKNLFVCDAAPFVSQPDKNVTLSIVAFAWRASEYLAEEMRKGNV